VTPTKSGSRVPGERRWFAAFGLLLAFNVWHTSNRGSWHGSPGEALTLGPQIRDFAARLDPDLPVHRPYDGQFYYAIAWDPLLRSGEVVPLLDDPAYRYRRILLPALAATLALGRPTLFPATLLAVNVAAFLLCGLAAWRLARHAGLSPPWLTAGVLSTTGLVYATFRTLPEPLALALVLWGILAFRRGQWAGAGALLGAAALAREETLLVTGVLVSWSLFRGLWRRRDLVRFAVPALIPALLWWAWLAGQLPPMATPPLARIGWPFAGWLVETAQAFTINETRTNLVRTLSVDFVALGLCLAAFLGIRRAPSLWGCLVLAQAGLCALLRGDIWLWYPGASRVVVPLTVFSLFWFAERARGIDPARARAAATDFRREPGRTQAAGGAATGA
jgi:hypothetical protein